MMNSRTCWALVPAAGVGRRMAADCPKQYLDLDGQSVLRRTLQRLHAIPALSHLLLIIHPDDAHFRQTMLADLPRVSVVYGRDERPLSVLAGLDALEGKAAAEDWVLVHDVVRPCVTPQDVKLLLDMLQDDPVGGLLAHPVRETLKRVDPEGRISETVSREQLWAADTPQIFRYQRLCQALRTAVAQGLMVTDEASALELAGQRPRVISGRSDNIKITVPGDLALATQILRAQSTEDMKR